MAVLDKSSENAILLQTEVVLESIERQRVRAMLTGRTFALRMALYFAGLETLLLRIERGRSQLGPFLKTMSP